MKSFYLGGSKPGGHQQSLRLLLLPLLTSLLTMAGPAVAQDAISESAIPSSNQSLFDEPVSAVYLSLERTSVLPTTWVVDHFSVNFKGEDKNHFDLDLMTRAARWSKSSLWVDYGVGILAQRGSVYDLTSQSPMDAESATLLVIPFRVGLQYHFDFSNWVIPFLGVQASESFYRVSSSLSSAEATGDYAMLGGLVGLQLKAPKFSNVSLLVEAIQEKRVAGLSQGRDGVDLLAGAGWLF